MQRILILGGTGMLGNTLLRHLGSDPNWDVCATARMTTGQLCSLLPEEMARRMREDVSADNFDTIVRAFASLRPDIVVNCIGLVKQDPNASDPLSVIQTNSLLPHRISMLCRTAGARLIHIGTDCVFSGRKGGYVEVDMTDPDDLYGRTKLLGEVSYRPHCLTLRTSLIGHELKGCRGLVEWFLRQQGPVKGYRQAIFSGFPCVEVARILADYVIPNPSLQGVYHVSALPITKMALLELIADQYRHPVRIEPSDEVVIDRSLDSTRFREATGYRPPDWPDLVRRMHRDYEENRGLFHRWRDATERTAT